jgi:hypothetical protein
MAKKQTATAQVKKAPQKSENRTPCKLILDIRYCESDHDNVIGKSLPVYVGQLYAFPKSVHACGARIARKLRQYGYTTGTFDHLYVNFTTVLKEHELQLSSRTVEPRIRYVDYGLRPGTIRRMKEKKREQFIADCTFRILTLLSGRDTAQKQLLEKVRAELDAAGSELEILYKVKETATYRVTITYQIRPQGTDSVAWIEYRDKHKDVGGKKRLTALQFYEDIFPLVGSIAVSGGAIRVKPRDSFKARLDTKRYRVPFVVLVEELVGNGACACQSSPIMENPPCQQY